MDKYTSLITGLTYEVRLDQISTPSREAMDVLEPIFDALNKVGSLELTVGRTPITVKFVRGPVTKGNE